MRIATASLMLFATCLLFLTGCEGPEGPQGPAGPSGNNPPLAPVITALVAIPDSIGTNQTTQFFVAAYDPNGDALSYHWIVPVGTLSSATVASPVWTATDSMGLFTVTVHVIAGGDTTAGTLLVGVNTYVPSVTPYYLGNNDMTCSHCHEGKVNGWMTTNHHASYKASQMSCNECHSTGWDEALDNGGYDDNPVAALQNVQCEACHGPMGPNPATHEPDTEANLAGETCAGCHESFYEDWEESSHGQAIENAGGMAAFVDEWGNSTCDDCHIGEGFLNKWDGDYAATPSYASGVAHEIGCGICHDAHDYHTETQLRAQSTITLPYPDGYTISDWGTGLLCGNCHRDRRTAANMTSHLTNGSAHFGPHESPQADMLEGVGTYEIPGYSYPVTDQQHVSITSDACVTCHVRVETPAGSGHPTETGHDFEPRLSWCQTCHTTATDFNIGNVQTETEALMEELADLIMANNPAITEFTAAVVGDTTISNYEDRVAAWAYFFVERDGSKGVHNRDYAELILQNSIDYYTAVTANRPNQDPWGVK